MTGSLNTTIQSCHVFLNITGQSRHAENDGITLVEGVMEKRMVTGHSHWDYRQPTVITSMAWVTSQMLLIFPLTTFEL